jgi:cellulose synthase/poly-beta-1,6-N-acetylglucosamine synthase-like glycosyltransferase
MSPKISVVVPTMNEEKYLEPCLKALKAQTFKDVEIIAIDKSTDSTPELCKKYGWKVVIQQGKGISGARMEGFAATSGEIIVSTDADTKPCKKWLARVEKAFRNPKVMAAYGPVYLIDGPLWLRLLSNVGYTIFLWIGQLVGKPNLSGQNSAVRKSAYDKVGGFNLELKTAEDVDLGLRVKKECGKVKFIQGMSVETSARRIIAYGVGRFLSHHIKNYFNIIFRGKASDNFDPVR